jgi:hypothetical protein
MVQDFYWKRTKMKENGWVVVVLWGFEPFSHGNHHIKVYMHHVCLIQSISARKVTHIKLGTRSGSSQCQLHFRTKLVSIGWSDYGWLPSECKNEHIQAFPPLAPSGILCSSIISSAHKFGGLGKIEEHAPRFGHVHLYQGTGYIREIHLQATLLLYRLLNYDAFDTKTAMARPFSLLLDWTHCQTLIDASGKANAILHLERMNAHLARKTMHAALSKACNGRATKCTRNWQGFSTYAPHFTVTLLAASKDLAHFSHTHTHTHIHTNAKTLACIVADNFSRE